MNRSTIFAMFFALLALGFGAGFAIANLDAHDSKNDHGHGMDDVSAMPIQAGQGAFAATAEIVSILEKSKDTDWSKVNINSLRQHLVDMNALFLEANVQEHQMDDGVRFEITGKGLALRAVQSMVPAHAKELTKMKLWSAEAVTTDHGADLTVRSDHAITVQRIRSLGFFGLMATGAHHQPHHLAMATGSRGHH